LADCWVIDDEEIPPVEVDYCAAIHVRADGYDLIPVEAGPAQHKAFLYAMKVGEFTADSRNLIHAPIIAPTTSTFRLVREPS
jgi:hypothetical protein